MSCVHEREDTENFMVPTCSHGDHRAVYVVMIVGAIGFMAIAPKVKTNKAVAAEIAPVKTSR